MSNTRTYLWSAGRNVVVQLLLKFCQYGLLLVVQVLVARLLGKDGLGLYSYVSSLSIPVWVAIEFGMDNYIVRELAGAPQRTHELSVRATSLRVVWGGVLVGLALIGGNVLLDTPEARAGFSLLILALIPRAISQTYFSLLVARQRYYHSLRLDIGGAALFAVCGVIVLPLTQSLNLLLICFLAIEILKMFAALVLYRSDVGAPLLRSLHFELRDMRRMALILAPFALVNIFVNLQMRLDVIMLEAYRGIAEVGVFSAAERFINASVALPSAVFNGLLPLLAMVAGQRFAQRFSGASLMVFTGIGLIVTLVMFFGAPWIIGATFQFPESVTVLKILSWAFTLLMFNAVSESLLYGRHMERTVLIVRGVGLALAIVTNMYFAPLYGATGTAIASTLTEFAMFIAFAWFVVSKKIVTLRSTEVGV